MLRIGDKPAVFTRNRYDGGGSVTFNDAFCSGKITILSFVNITGGWNWVYYLLKLRAMLPVANVNMVTVFNNYTTGTGVDETYIDAKFPFPIGSGTERRFTKNDLTPADPATAGFYSLMDTDNSVAFNYMEGFNPANDPSFNANCDGDKLWTYFISSDGYITDKWETSGTANNYPISFLQYNLHISTLNIAGTFAIDNTARLALSGLGLAGNNYVDITYAYNATLNSNVFTYTYTMDSPFVVKVYPEYGTTSSVLEEIIIQFSSDITGANVLTNYTLSGTASGLTISMLEYQGSFNSAYFGASACYLKQRINNLLASPQVLKMTPEPASVINLLPNNTINVAFSKPVGSLIASPPTEELLDIANIKRAINYDLYQANGLTLSEIKYESSGYKSISAENIGKVENVATLKFTGTLLGSGPLGLKMNESAPAGEKISDTAGTLLAGNNGNPYYTANWTVADLTPPKVISLSLNPR